MTDLARREFLRRTVILATGSLFISCEDEQEKAEPDSPGELTGKGPTKDVIIVGAGMAGLAGELGSDAAAKETGSQLVLMGIFGWIASVAALIGACLSIAKPRFASLTIYMP